MRWNNPKRDLDQRKTVTKFLWLPVEVSSGDVRWLEKATIVYRPNVASESLWTAVCFVDKEASHD
jgi:hypothetical protein